MAEVSLAACIKYALLIQFYSPTIVIHVSTEYLGHPRAFWEFPSLKDHKSLKQTSKYNDWFTNGEELYIGMPQDSSLEPPCKIRNLVATLTI